MTEILPWVRKASKMLADCRVFPVNESPSISPRTGNEHSFYYIGTSDWVNVVPITVDSEVVFVRQFRHGSEQISLEIPGGMVDSGEDPLDAAVRECLEESGYRAKDVASLGVLNPNPALFSNKLHTFVARKCEAVSEISNTSTEHTEVQLIPLSRLPEILKSGLIDHALVAATLWRLLFLESR